MKKMDIKKVTENKWVKIAGLTVVTIAGVSAALIFKGNIRYVDGAIWKIDNTGVADGTIRVQDLSKIGEYLINQGEHAATDAVARVDVYYF